MILGHCPLKNISNQILHCGTTDTTEIYDTNVELPQVQQIGPIIFHIQWQSLGIFIIMFN